MADHPDTLYVPVPIESVAQAEALPVGSIIVNAAASPAQYRSPLFKAGNGMWIGAMISALHSRDLGVEDTTRRWLVLTPVPTDVQWGATRPGNGVWEWEDEHRAADDAAGWNRDGDAFVSEVVHRYCGPWTR